MFGIYVIAILFGIIGFLVQNKLRSKVSQYSKMSLRLGLSGKEIAEKMLSQNGIYDVKVVSVAGQLTDHYNPAQKTVNLSQDVYHGRSAISAAIAAHECGHAIQHNIAYPLIGFRSSIVPIVNIAGTVLPWLLMIGVLFLQRIPGLLLVAIVAQALITLFTLVTLPVEFDASKRALNWMQLQGIVIPQEYDAAKDALKWAAMTYVVVALAAVAQLLYLISKYTGSRRS
jgi:uncharacterized protein